MRNKTNQEIREQQLLDYIAERKARNPDRTPSRTWTNATTSTLHTGIVMQSARAEADQHFDCLSAPMAAQIVRT